MCDGRNYTQVTKSLQNLYDNQRVCTINAYEAHITLSDKKNANAKKNSLAILTQSKPQSKVILSKASVIREIMDLK